MTFKRFLTVFTGVVLLFILVNYLIWNLATEMLLTNKYDGGDLARLGYLKEFKHPRKSFVDLPRQHELLTDFSKPYDLLVIGDSFTLGIVGGRNLFFQDYIASINNIRVASLWPYPTAEAVSGVSPLSSLILLYNSGLLDAIKPRYVLLESAQRFCIQRFARPFDFSMNEPPEKMIEFHRDKKYSFDYLPPMGFLNNGNAKYVYYNIMYHLLGHSVTVPSFHLTWKAFSVKWGDRLLVLPEEVSNTALATPASVSLMNDNLNHMAALLKRKGIELYFMPAVDKYELYRDSIVEDGHRSYPRSIFFEELRKQPKEYHFIDTKQLLGEELKRGEQDMYYADDSHWSWKASRKIFETVRFK